MISTPTRVEKRADACLADVQDALEERIATGRLDIPLLPDTAMQILALAADPDADNGAVARAVQGDPALAARVLRMANSPLFVPAGPIATLQQAVARLGIRQVSSLALAASIGATAFRAVGFVDIVDHLREEATSVAGWSREVARRLKKNPETAFLCGLIHRIGGPVVLKAIHEIGERLRTPLDEVDALLLMRAYGAPVGAAVAGAWRLPEVTRAVIASGGDMTRSERFGTAIAILRAARCLSSHTRAGRESRPIDVAFDALDLYPDEVDALLARADAVRAFAASMDWACALTEDGA